MATNLFAAPLSEEQQPVYQRKSSMTQLPLEHREFLLRLKRAVESVSLLHEGAYSSEALQGFLGNGYTIRYSRPADGALDVTFDDLDNTYVGEDGQLTDLGRHLPCFRRGSILFRAAGREHKATMNFGALTSARVTPASSFFPRLVEEVFGAPASIAEGYPTTPPLHGRDYVPEKKTHKLGNTWMTYKFEDQQSVATLRFRTLGDGVVAEVSLSVEEK